MATLVLIHHKNGQIIPAVPSDVKPGERFQWVRNGQLGPMLKALAPAQLIPAVEASAKPEWSIEAEPV